MTPIIVHENYALLPGNGQAVLVTIGKAKSSLCCLFS